MLGAQRSQLPRLLGQLLFTRDDLRPRRGQLLAHGRAFLLRPLGALHRLLGLPRVGRRRPLRLVGRARLGLRLRLQEIEPVLDGVERIAVRGIALEQGLPDDARDLLQRIAGRLKSEHPGDLLARQRCVLERGAAERPAHRLVEQEPRVLGGQGFVGEQPRDLVWRQRLQPVPGCREGQLAAQLEQPRVGKAELEEPAEKIGRQPLERERRIGQGLQRGGGAGGGFGDCLGLRGSDGRVDALGRVRTRVSHFRGALRLALLLTHRCRAPSGPFAALSTVECYAWRPCHPSHRRPSAASARW